MSVIEQERLQILAERKGESTTETYSCQTTTDSNVEEHNNGSGRTTANKNDNVLEEITEVPVKKCVPYGYALLSDKKTYVNVG
ncbi:hypothetical protein C0J52_17790 [Blattella germanica]|nr:hypothetical protein C0J52_17790 [Blattella germanica]